MSPMSPNTDPDSLLHLIYLCKHNDPKPMGRSKSSAKREVDSNTSLPQETGNISNKQPNLAPKAIRERRTKKPKR